MKRRPGVLIAGILIVVLFVAVQLLYVVREGEVVVVTFLGKPVHAKTDAGLFMRKPWPFQKNYTFDNRLRTMETVHEESLTLDQKNVLMSMYAAWNISEPIQFVESVGGVSQAESNLEDLIRNEKNQVLGKYPLSSLVNIDAEKLRFLEMEAEILGNVRAEAAERYGIQVAAVGIHRFDFPEGITESVFTRMREERNALAEGARAEGNKDASKIRAEAKRESARIVTEAEAKATRLMAEADASVLSTFDAFKEDQELAVFLHRMEALEELLQGNSTVFRTIDDPPFNLFKESSGTIEP